MHSSVCLWSLSRIYGGLESSLGALLVCMSNLWMVLQGVYGLGVWRLRGFKVFLICGGRGGGGAVGQRSRAVAGSEVEGIQLLKLQTH